MQWRHSILWRIFLYYTGLITLSVASLITAFYFFQLDEHRRLVEIELQRNVLRLIPRYFPPGSIGGAQRQRPRQNINDEFSPSRPRPGLGPWDRFPGDPDFQPRQEPRRIDSVFDSEPFLAVYDAGESLISQNEEYPEKYKEDPPFIDVETNGPWGFFETDEYFCLIHRLRSKGTIFVGIPKENLYAALRLQIYYASSVGVIIIIVSSALGYIIIRKGLRPIRHISDAAERISDGKITERIDTQGVHSELGQLAEVLNKTFDRLSESLQRQIQFTSDASHELRTPVAAILADCQFSLKRERSAERYKETIEVCHESAQHMRSLIEDLRVLASLDEQSDEKVREIIILDEWLSSILSVITPLAQEKNISISKSLKPVQVYIDPIRMKQAAINILNNAVRYTDNGGEITVRCGKEDGYAFFEVNDTGCGIPHDKIDKVFDRFYRTDDARSTHTGGAGLGLSISKSIVEAHSGKITLNSVLFVGSTFRIQLPLEDTISGGK